MFTSALKFTLPWRILIFVFIFLLPGLALAQEAEDARGVEQVQQAEATIEPAKLVDAQVNGQVNARANAQVNATQLAVEAKQKEQTEAAEQALEQEAGEHDSEQASQAQEDASGDASGAALGAAQATDNPTQTADPLPLWIDGPAKKAIIAFVEAAVTPGNGFIEPENRIAAFDNDGTLIPEYPAYFQLLYGLERLKAAASDHPEWESAQIYKEL